MAVLLPVVAVKRTADYFVGADFSSVLGRGEVAVGSGTGGVALALT